MTAATDRHGVEQDTFSLQNFMEVGVEGRRLLIPLAPIKSVISLNGITLQVSENSHSAGLGILTQSEGNIPVYDLGW
ncbi:MAG: hypothetical protein MI673_07330, partial [Thiotrichales bacterium]|nr:hypothetical protein [Thiotrichales bacterium]